ncbi:MAG: hypothetical protein ACRDFB_05665, partial [Rhabdochlamydiaceae bacterium]
MTVDEYERMCCFGKVAEIECYKEVDKILGTVNEKREEFIEKHGNLDYEGSEELWEKEVINPRQELLKELIEKHPLKDKPNPNCGFYTKDFCRGDRSKIGKRFEDGFGCGGTGYYKSTYNPKSKWDCYTIGGRWRGSITCVNPKDD